MEKKYGILLKYYKGIVDEEKNQQFINELELQNISLMTNDLSRKPMCSAEDFTNLISLVFNNTLVQSILIGIITSGSYDVLKAYIIWLWNSTKGTFITKLYPGGDTEKKNTTFGLSLYVDNYTKLNFRLEGDLSDIDKSKCIDKVFEFAKDLPQRNQYPIDDFVRYDEDNKKWYTVDIRKEIEKKALKNNEDNNNS